MYALVYYPIFKVDTFDTREQLVDYLKTKKCYDEKYDIIRKFVNGELVESELQYGKGVIPLDEPMSLGWISRVRYHPEMRADTV